jgi:hypothetical protein
VKIARHGEEEQEEEDARGGRRAGEDWRRESAQELRPQEVRGSIFSQKPRLLRRITRFIRVTGSRDLPSCLAKWGGRLCTCFHGRGKPVIAASPQQGLPSDLAGCLVDSCSQPHSIRRNSHLGDEGLCWWRKGQRETERKGGRRRRGRAGKAIPQFAKRGDLTCSLCARRGKVPALVRELIKDTRRMMSPYTALKLTERKSNSLKDFVALSGTLGCVYAASPFARLVMYCIFSCAGGGAPILGEGWRERF